MDPTAQPRPSPRGSRRVDIIDRDLSTAGLADWWNGLPGPRRTLMLRWEYLAAWYDAFMPHDGRLHIPVVYDRDEPVAALPLYRRHGALRSLASGAHCEVFDAAWDPGRPDAVDALVDVVLRRRTRLERVDGDSPLLAGLRRAAPPMIVDPEQSPYVDLPATAEALLAGCSSKFRANVRRADRGLAALGTVSLDEYRGGQPGMEQALATLLGMETASWKGAQRSAISSRPDTLRFYRHLAVDGPVRRWARISLLRVGDRVVAAQLDLEYGASRYGMKMASVEDLPRQSPGTVLLWRVLQDCIARGVGRLEFGGELDHWKRHWTSTVAARATVRTWPHTMVGQLAYGAREHVKHAVRPLRRPPHDPPPAAPA